MRAHLLSTIPLLLSPFSGPTSAIASGGPDDLPEWKPDPNAERTAIPEIYKWKLGRLFADEAARGHHHPRKRGS